MSDPRDTSSGSLLARSLESGRIHSAYLLSGPGDAPRSAALDFVRGVVCTGPSPRPCQACASCGRSGPREEIAIDGTGRKGPLLRHVGDHPDLLWVERGTDDTRVRIGQIRALQHALRLRSSEGGRRAAVVADAEWLNQEAQNALLRLLEEPPRDTALVLVAATSAGMLATVRSRCQRVAFRDTGTPGGSEANGALVARLEAIGAASAPDLLDWAEEFRGPRAVAAARVEDLLRTATQWLVHRVHEQVDRGDQDVRREIDVSHVLSSCRKSLVQRNANPQMVAERALFALAEGVRR